MKINTSQISMDASAEHKDVTGKLGQINAGRERGQPAFQLNIPGMMDFRLQRVEENRQSQQLCAASSVHCPEGKTDYETSADQVIERMVEGVVGQRIRLRKITGLESQGNFVFFEPVNPPGQQVAFSFAAHSTHYEYEKVSVNSTGSVELADGRNIDFSLQLTMERESMVRESVAWQAAERVLLDPLVLNFDCDLRSLINKSFQFDMNCDGETDTLCSLQPGTGLLALDLNNDQEINDGRELFGPTTGLGFQELAQYDFDLNGWIDKNDPIFSSLRIWRPGESRKSGLMSLSEAGVGAICLTHDKSGFQLKDRRNNLMGEVAATGIFLTEAGEVRPIQEIKLALQEKKQEPIGFLRQMIATRQDEVKTLARLNLSRREQREEDNLFEKLFPEWQKEMELASVMARTERSSPG